MKKMKIGILTYHNTTNYGAIFQCYALQKYIINKGIQCEIINYNSNVLKNRYSINIFSNNNIKQVLKKILNYRVSKGLNKSFEKFTKENIKLSQSEYNEFSIDKANQEYDKFIVGSDQIWNFKLSGDDKNYYLDFVKDNDKKNSYAASFGITSFERNQEKIIIDLLEKFKNISVREKHGVELINKLGIKNEVSQHIDPVFLLKQEGWSKFICQTKFKKKYILVYEITYTKNMMDFARKLAKIYNYKIIFVSGTNRKMKGAMNKSDLSPEQFLSYLKNAEYIVTSSFHCMAFSIIFNKEFYYDVPEHANNTSSRLDSLAELLNLTERKLDDNKEICGKTIDYAKVNKIVNLEILKADEYLNGLIGEARDE